MKFNKRDLLLLGAGILVSLAIVSLSGSKKETPVEQCEYEKANCENELDECIASQR